MELYKDMLIKILEENKIMIDGLDKIIENRCYKTLQEIIKIVKDTSLDDNECFWRIEKIVAELENLGSSGGFRHDFG